MIASRVGREQSKREQWRGEQHQDQEQHKLVLEVTGPPPGAALRGREIDEVHWLSLTADPTY
ncbi:hypothetical protein E2C01_002358 [Portunus trituberculatus]|uniref:Uncharacterized protein n=1 Tax=Portunus trituberculatus TaxID=210409 RepID=A0A5B7CJQ3_PORTR|nr:hypothetical protein [Portunus trituberculatus]